MTRPKLLDLFCGAGGCSVGYHRAGFDVVGVDIEPQPRYPFDFVQADAMTFPLDGFDAIHASPPCQAFTSMQSMPNARAHPDLLTPMRERLLAWGGPYIIENVVGAPLVVQPPSLFTPLSGIVLCGSMFGLRTEQYELRRHRLFESNTPLYQPVCQHRADRTVVGFYGDHARTRRRYRRGSERGGDITGAAAKLALVRDLMGIDWMAWAEANQAIPPAYTTYIGAQLLAALRQEVLA